MDSALTFWELTKFMITRMMVVTVILSAFARPANHSAHAAELRGGFGGTADMHVPYDINAVKSKLHHLQRSPELVVELDKIIESLDETAPKMFRVELDLFKLDILAKIEEAEIAASLAAQIYADHPRDSFPSDLQYGDTMYQIVESLAKTDNLGFAYQIIQELRASLYNKPNTYLSFIVDKSLIEVHIETSDFRRALNLALSVLDNPDYVALDAVKKWRPAAINEIAYLYNQLGEGENALLYLKEAADTFETQNLPIAKIRKARALNYANRGRAYLLTQNYAQARRMGEAVQNANKDLQQGYLTAVSHRLIGCADYHDGKYEQAAAHLKAGIALAETENSLSLKRSLYLDYAQTLEKLGQGKSAAKWYKTLYNLETMRQETIANTRAKLNDLEFSAYKNHQERMHLHHELERNQTLNKLMLLATFSLMSGSCLLMWLFWNLRKHQKELMRSEMKAKIANRAKSDFLANMSHEIRTPMNGVLGMAQVLEKTPLSAQQKIYLDIVKQSGNTLLDLINDILDFSKIEADKLTLNYQPCDLDRVVRDIVALLKPNADERGIDLTYSFASDLPKNFMLDEKRIRQIVMNLIGNAVKFTAQGSVNVTIDGQLQEGDAQIQICVSDTGVGIEPDHLGLIFEKFTQTGSNINRSSGGTGLGLAISSKLTKAMKGNLSVDSELGQGSRFILSLPAELAPPLKIQDRATEVQPASLAA